MLRLSALLLALVVFTGSVMDLHELAKLPYLVRHFHQHQMKDGHFSLHEFFSLHYGTQASKHDKEEHEKHKGLPFKTHDCTSIHTTVFQSKISAPVNNAPVTTVAYTNFYQSAFSSDFHQSVWQPPRTA